MNYKAIGASEMYYDLVRREDEERDEAWVRLGKAEQPVSSSQCYFCKRGIQPTEPIVRSGESIAHEGCVRFLIGLINAGRTQEKEYVKEPQYNMAAVREDVAQSERAVMATKAELSRALQRRQQSASGGGHALGNYPPGIIRKHFIP